MEDNQLYLFGCVVYLDKRVHVLYKQRIILYEPTGICVINPFSSISDPCRIGVELR
jgi:hypothetical protein